MCTFVHIRALCTYKKMKSNFSVIVFVIGMLAFMGCSHANTVPTKEQTPEVISSSLELETPVILAQNNLEESVTLSVYDSQGYVFSEKPNVEFTIQVIPVIDVGKTVSNLSIDNLHNRRNKYLKKPKPIDLNCLNFKREQMAAHLRYVIPTRATNRFTS